MENIIRAAVKDVPDFPKEGIIFKDITPVLKDPDIFGGLIDYMYERYKDKKIDSVVCVESRGFIIGSPLAYKLKVPLVPVRKPGKLPRETYREEYRLEYGNDALEIHRDSLEKGARIVLIDDLLATGGTVSAASRLMHKFDAVIEEIFFIIELDFLKGREKLEGHSIHSVVHY
ncbi:MAG: adenine phosphoribosyltransferase [Candidatus Goldiibacteriota bacterium]